MTGNRDVEDRLRRALHDYGDGLEPSGDGLTRIRERLRPSTPRPVRTVLATAAVVAAAAVIIAIPTVLHTGGRADHSTVGAGAELSPSAQRPIPTQPESTAADRTAAWPYPDLAVAAAHPTDPRLRMTATQLTLRFVQTVAGDDAAVVPDRLERAGDRVTVTLVRPDLGGRVVSRVTLLAVPRTRGYVVTGATADGLGLDRVDWTSGRDDAVLSGRLIRRAGRDAAPVVRLRLRVGSAAALSSTGSLGPPVDATWSRAVALADPVTGPGLAAAWTVDQTGGVVDFAATPTR